MSNELSLCILEYLDTHLYQEISMDALSFFFGYDKTYLMKRFKADIGVSIKTYINQKKVFSSLEKLNGDSYLLKVALESGFHSLEYYSEIFSKFMGVSPSVFRKYLRGACTMEELQRIREALLMMELFEERLENFKKSVSTGHPLLVLHPIKKNAA